MPDLLHAHALLPLGTPAFAEGLGERAARQADQRRLRRRDITLQRPLLDEAGRDGRFRLGGGRKSHGQSSGRALAPQLKCGYTAGDSEKLPKPARRADRGAALLAVLVGAVEGLGETFQRERVGRLRALGGNALDHGVLARPHGLDYMRSLRPRS